METSAKDATNVEIAFERVLTEIYKITAKNVVKEPKSDLVKLDKGKKLDGKEDEDEAPVRAKGVRLDEKKTKNKNKSGCC